MASWVSDRGVWKPAKERSVNIETGDIYEGEDREALKLLKERGVKTLGMDSEKDIENIKRAREIGMTVREFLNLNEDPSPETLIEEEKKKNLVVTHAKPKSKEGVDPQGGVASPNVGSPGKENQGGFDG